MTTLIIDADTILYQALSNAEQEVEFDEDVWMLTCDHRKARSSFDDRVDWLMKTSDADDYILCFSHSENFRKDVYPLYKANRKKTRKPMGFLEFRAKVMQDYTNIVKPRLEADDTVGILATKMDDCIIYSEDKDLLQIPGKHMKDEEIIEVSVYDGDRFHMMQTLTGDAVDGYPGCPGVGPVKAEKLLSVNPAEWWGAVIETYTKAGLTEADALTMARVSRILRLSDWDSKKQEPILWTPTISQ